GQVGGEEHVGDHVQGEHDRRGQEHRADDGHLVATRTRRSFSPARQRSRWWADGAIRNAVARVAQTIEAKKALRIEPGSWAKRCWKGAVSRKARSTWTPGMTTRSSWSSSISSRSSRSFLLSPSDMGRPPPVQSGFQCN